MVEATNLKFGVQMDYNEYCSKNAKFGIKGAWPRSCDLLLNFGPPLYLRNGLSYELDIWCADRIQRVLFKKCKIMDKRGVA